MHSVGMRRRNRTASLLAQFVQRRLVTPQDAHDASQVEQVNWRTWTTTIKAGLEHRSGLRVPGYAQ